MDWRALQQELQRGKRAQLYLLYGEDEWQVQQAVQALLRLIPESLRSLNVNQVSAKNAQPGDLEEYLQGSLFGDERLLLLEEPRFLSTRRRNDAADDRKKLAAEEKRWQDALELLQQELIVVLIHPGSLDKRRSIVKWLEKQAIIVECNPLKRNDMLGLIQAQLRSLHIEAEYGVAERIQEIAGDMPGIAMQEIDKLSIAYPGIKRLRLQDAVPILSTSIEAEVYTLFDLMAERKLEQVFELLDELVRRGESAPRILAALASQLRRMLQLRSLAAQGVRGDAAARQLGLHPFAARKLMEKAASLDDRSLSALLSGCAEKDSMMKSGRLGMETGLHLIFLEMAAAMRQPGRSRSAR